MKVAIYIRVSTQEQALEGYSIDAQKERLESYCKAKGWKLVSEYVDAGFSGSNLNRPNMQRMLKDAVQNKFDAVLVYKLDRISRSQKDTLYLIEDIFLKNNISFVSLNENFDTSSAFGRAMIGILSVFAQLEREQIKERTRMGLEERTKQGKHHSYAPFGYRYVNKKLVIEENEAEVVRKIYQLAAENKSFSQINKYVLKHYPEYTSFNNKNNKISDILHNSTYGGFVKFGSVTSKGVHEAIVDEETYNKAQTIALAKFQEWEKDRTKRTGTHSHYLLTGFVFCGECGARFRSVPRHKGTYTCYSRFGSPAHMVKDKDCKSPIYTMAELDALVLQELKKINYDESYFDNLKSKPSGENNAALDRNKKELEKLNGQINKLLDLYQFDNIDVATLTPRLNALSEQKKQLEKTVLEFEKVSPLRLNYKEVQTLLLSVDSLIEKGATAQLRELLQILINKVIVSTSGIEISWNF